MYWIQCSSIFAEGTLISVCRYLDFTSEKKLTHFIGFPCCVAFGEGKYPAGAPGEISLTYDAFDLVHSRHGGLWPFKESVGELHGEALDRWSGGSALNVPVKPEQHPVNTLFL